MKNGTKSAVEEFERAIEASVAETVARRFAKTFPSTEALNNYLQKHPKADARSHSVARPQDRSDEEKSTDDLKSRARHNKKEKSKPSPRAHGEKLINKAQKAKEGKPAYNAWKDVEKHLRDEGDHEGADHAGQEASAHRVKMMKGK